MNNVLITGATGFVGKNLIAYLNTHEFIVETLHIRYGMTISLPKANIIIHLSGKAHDLKNVSNPSDYYQGNFELTKQLYDAFLKSDAEKFIFLSSVKAVADCVEGVLTEDVIPNPQTHYGKSKLLAEQYIQNQFISSGKSYYILRPCMIHGPQNKGNLNLLYQFVKSGIPNPLGLFKNQRSFLSVENLCFVIKKLINNPIESGIYHVGDDENISTNEVITIIANTLNKKVKTLNTSKKLVVFLSKLGDILKLPINSEKLTKLTENYQVSNKKITSAIGEPLPLSVRDGLKITINSFN